MYQLDVNRKIKFQHFNFCGTDTWCAYNLAQEFINKIGIDNVFTITTESHVVTVWYYDGEEL